MMTNQLIRQFADAEGRRPATGRSPAANPSRSGRWRRRTYDGTVSGSLFIGTDPGHSRLELCSTLHDDAGAVADLAVSSTLTDADSTGCWRFAGTGRRRTP